MNRISRWFKGKDVGHVAYITIPEEYINTGWFDVEMTVEGFNQKHDGKFTTFTGKVRCNILESDKE